VAPKQEKVAASSAILAIADNRFSPRFSVAVLGGYFTGSGLLYWNNADLNMNGWHLGLDARYNVTDAWSVGLLFDQHQCAFTPSDRMFSAGPLVSTRRYFGSEQHDYLEGGLAFCYLHLNKQTKHYNIVANNFMPMILFNYSVKVSDWLSVTPGVRIGISAIHKFSTVDDDGGRSLVDRYGTIGFNFTCVEFSLAFQFSFK
jgi:hypothetical protein